MRTLPPGIVPLRHARFVPMPYLAVGDGVLRIWVQGLAEP